MTINEVENYRYWADEYGNIWERRSYCLEPTVEFAKLSSVAETDCRKPSTVGGAIGCRNVSFLKPITLPEFEEQSK